MAVIATLFISDRKSKKCSGFYPSPILPRLKEASRGTMKCWTLVCDFGMQYRKGLLLLLVFVLCDGCSAARADKVDSGFEPKSAIKKSDDLSFSKGEGQTQNILMIQNGIEAFLINISQYIQNVSVLTCSFQQTVTHDQQKTRRYRGQLFWQRREKEGVLVQIDVPDLHQKCVVRDGMFYVTNLDTKKTSAYNLAHTLLDAIFADNPQLNRRFPASQVMLLSMNSIQESSRHRHFDTACVILKKRENSAPTLWLFFSLYDDKGLSLLNNEIKGSDLRIKAFMGWSVKDPQGTTTQVSFDPSSLRVNDPSVLARIPGLFIHKFQNNDLNHPASSAPQVSVQR